MYRVLNQDLSIFIVPRVKSGPDLLMLYRNKIMKALPVEQIIKSTGNNLEVPENPQLDWILVSDIRAFGNQNLTDSQLQEIRNYFKDMFAIYFLDGIIVYMIQNYRSPKDIIKYLDSVNNINSIVNS